MVKGLPRPDVPPGAQRDLVDALHALHHEAGWPSLRVLGREAGCSHTTVSTVFSSPRLPSWGVLELVVEAMGGQVGEFHRLWLAASSPAQPSTASAPRIAGRRAELAAVRHHLDSGTGLLLVTGEAGIGKTRLVDVAADSATDVFVARGACLPLSTQVPLLAVTDVLRSVYEVDQGQWFKEALADCPPYVGASLRGLLPELETLVVAPAMPEDDWSGQRLLSAVATALAALAAARPLAVLVEDLHWADSTTRDLVEHLATRHPVEPGPPLVATWRLDDPSIPSATRDWLARVRRLPTVVTLELGLLTRDESAELLELVGASATPPEVDRIHQRSSGLPLFTEQLGAQPADQESLPGLLADLLDRRFTEIGDREWDIARALGVADRPLTDAQLRALTGLSSPALTAGLHALDEQRLTTTVGDRDVRLRHPLFAEAVRRRLVAGEAADVHRRLALVLAESPNPSAAEIAEHWQRADDPGQEISWRIRAAEEAGARFAAAQEAEQWRRALRLWPDDSEHAGSPGVRKVDAYLAAIGALDHVDWPAAAALADEALRSVREPDGLDAAAVYRRAGEIQGKLGNLSGGLSLLDRALRIFASHAPSVGYVKSLSSRDFLLRGLDRYGEATAERTLAVEISGTVGDPVLHRALVAEQAIDDADAGRLDRALDRVRTATDIETLRPDPIGDIIIANHHAHILSTACRGADEILAAGRPGLEAANAWGIDDFSTSVLLGTVSEALRHAGRVHDAARLIDPVTERPPAPHRWPTYSERAQLDLLRGRCRDATRLLGALSQTFVIDLVNRVVCAQDAPIADLWCGRPESAYIRLTTTLRDVASVEDDEVDVAGLIVLAARAAADLAPTTDDGTRSRLLGELRGILGRTSRDPFGRSDVYAVRPALRAAWTAEMSRLSGAPSMDRWAAAATQWDTIARPHDSAYCRWREAQVALATGQAALATKLLRRAERDAAEHLPLLGVIRTTIGAPYDEAQRGQGPDGTIR